MPALDFPTAISLELAATRRILNYVESLSVMLPNVGLYATGDSLDDLVFDDPESAPTDEQILQYQFQASQLLWILCLTTEGNELIDSAVKYHTESQSTMQNSVYELKYKEAQRFLSEREANPFSPLTPMIGRESEATGEDPVALAQAIVANYNTANHILSEYIGYIEGERRKFKQHINAATSVAELEALSWPVLISFDTYLRSVQL